MATDCHETAVPPLPMVPESTGSHPSPRSVEAASGLVLLPAVRRSPQYDCGQMSCGSRHVRSEPPTRCTQGEKKEKKMGFFGKMFSSGKPEGGGARVPIAAGAGVAATEAQRPSAPPLAAEEEDPLESITWGEMRTGRPRRGSMQRLSAPKPIMLTPSADASTTHPLSSNVGSAAALTAAAPSEHRQPLAAQQRSELPRADARYSTDGGEDRNTVVRGLLAAGAVPPTIVPPSRVPLQIQVGSCCKFL